MSVEQVDSLSLDIANQALGLPIWDHTYYHIFLSIAEKKEVNTEFLLHILQGRDKSIVVPKTSFSPKKLTHILLQENTVLKLSKYGIPEPESGIEIPAAQLDVIFVPLLTYDTSGNRIGYGGGFYDQFLENCSENTLFIGLSFFEPEANLLPVAQNDISLHYCITPNNIYTFSR